MSGFSKEWLLLREPIDEASRNADLAAGLSEHLAGRTLLRFADFGCGTGSNLRATALRIPAQAKQRWRLFDHDPKLLQAASETLIAWADEWTADKAGLQLVRDGRVIEVMFRETDLDRDVDGLLEPGEIATASAFFDLVSSAWIERFAKAAASAGAIVYATLSYNGFEVWSPPHPGDGSMLAAFNAHQRRDKGFGRASGPKAAAALAQSLSAEGFTVRSGDSPWRLTTDDRALISMLADGSAAAIAELNLFDEAAIERWRASRRSAESCIIGHTDILAVPPA